MIPFYKILVIDDDAVDRLHLKRSLAAADFPCEITECDSASSAFEKINEASFDCIFLDYMLRGDNGLLLLKKIRESGMAIPVVMITSHGSERIAVELMKAGASDYIVKNQINGENIGQIVRNSVRLASIEKERAEALTALKESESRLAEAQRLAKIGSWELRKDDQTCWSDEVYQILELKREHVASSVDQYLKAVHPEDKADVEKILMMARAGEEFNADHRLCTQAGIKYVNIKGCPIREASGQLIKVIGTIQDITSRKLAEQEISKARELAEDSLKVREIFLANMSHEIRTPMNAIIGFTQLLYESRLTQEQRSFVDAIHFSGENLLVIINDILDLSKIQSGKMMLERIDFNLNDLLKGITNTLRRRAHEKGLQLIYDVDENVQPLVKGDPVRVNQILTNLISNAIKFSESGYVKLHVASIETALDKFQVHFSVQDTGIGIPKEKQEQIFETFVQASSDTTRRYGGTGLGLTIVKSIVELHNGSIRVESQPGQGSTFHVYLPFEKADQEIVEIRNQDITNPEPLHLLKRASILVVEDNHVNQLLVKRVLDKTGCTTDVVSNGLEAINIVKSGKYDLILMDIQMPEMDGYAATKYIRAELQPPISEIPIIAMTAHALASEVDKCISIGMDDYVSKPFKQEVLYSKIVKHLKKSSNLGIIPLHKNEKEVTQQYSIDLSPLYEISDGDNAFVEDLIQMYEKQTPDFVEKLGAALRNRDLSVIQSICHQIKSSYGIVEVHELNETLSEISLILKRKNNLDSQRLSGLVNALISMITEITAEVKRNVRKTG